MFTRDVCPQELVEWEFYLILTARKLKRADIPQLVLSIFDQIEISDKKLSSRLFIVLSELVNNALDHGLLKLSSVLKDSREGIEQYYEERAARLEKLEHGEIRLRLCKTSDHARQCLKIDVHDSGSGFDHTEVLSHINCNVNEARHGRGIALVRHMGGMLSYSGNGSEVHVCLPVCEEQCAYRSGAEAHITLSYSAQNDVPTASMK